MVGATGSHRADDSEEEKARGTSDFRVLPFFLPCLFFVCVSKTYILTKDAATPPGYIAEIFTDIALASLVGPMSLRTAFPAMRNQVPHSGYALTSPHK